MLGRQKILAEADSVIRGLDKYTRLMIMCGTEEARELAYNYVVKKSVRGMVDVLRSIEHDGKANHLMASHNCLAFYAEMDRIEL